jgi:dockerin type I repeat protein
MQAFGDDVIFFGTELADAITAHSDDKGETFTVVQNPLASAGNDQAWSYLGPFGDMRPGGPLPTDEPYVLAGWMRIGASAVFSFDGGLTFPIQTPLAGNDGSGPIHVVCRNSAHAPNNPGDTRIPNAAFANHKAGRHGTWGTDRKFYWTEPANGANPGDRDLYVCKTADFGVNWTGVKHPVPFGPASDFVVSHSAFDNKGTLYVLHGDKLYVSFNQGESFAFVHTLPRYGSARRSDAGSDQFFVVDCGTIHIGLLADAGEGRGNVFYLRGSHVDTATPTWDEELVDQVGNVRLDFIYIVLDGNGVPTISYTTPDLEVTTASRKFPVSLGCVAPVSAVSRKTHGSAGAFDINLPLTGSSGVECRTGGPTGNHQVVITFALPVTVNSASLYSGMGSVSSATVSGNQVFVNLTGIANGQTVAIRLLGVSDGSATGNVVVPISLLLGDTTANGAVNSSDVSQTKMQSGSSVTANNFRTDVTANGSVNSSDVSTVKLQSGTALP